MSWFPIGPKPDKIRRVCSFRPAQLEPTDIDLPPTLNYRLVFKETTEHIATMDLVAGVRKEGSR